MSSKRVVEICGQKFFCPVINALTFTEPKLANPSNLVLIACLDTRYDTICQVVEMTDYTSNQQSAHNVHV